MRAWANTPIRWNFLPLGIRLGEKRFKSVSWRVGCQGLGRYVELQIGWRFPIQDIHNLVTGLVIAVRNHTIILGFLNGIAEMEFWITGKSLGGRKSIHDPIGRGFVARVFRSESAL